MLTYVKTYMYILMRAYYIMFVRITNACIILRSITYTETVLIHDDVINVK